MKIKKIYDNGGKTIDQYTIVFNEKNDIDSKYWVCLGVGQGFSQWGDCAIGNHLGTEVKFEALPESIKNHIAERLVG